MSDERKVYSEAEVIEILKEAKKLGVVELRLAGFAAAFNVQGGPVDSPSHQLPQQIIQQGPIPTGYQPQSVRQCQCGAPIMEHWKTWCDRCYRPRGRGRYPRYY